MDLAELCLPCYLQSLQEVCFSLTWEAHHDICGDGNPRHFGPQRVHNIQELPAGIAALHPLQDSVTPALQGNMQMAADSRVPRCQLNQLLSNFVGINGTDA